MYFCNSSFRGVEYIAVEKPAGAYTNILFSSGTTGKPMQRNGIMRVWLGVEIVKSFDFMV